MAVPAPLSEGELLELLWNPHQLVVSRLPKLKRIALLRRLAGSQPRRIGLIGQ
jgi:predicted DNA-binding protein (MmcQ/YjbR family)